MEHGEGMVQTTNAARAAAAKAEVVSIILWFWVRIPVGPPIRDLKGKLWCLTQSFADLANLYDKTTMADLYVREAVRQGRDGAW